MVHSGLAAAYSTRRHPRSTHQLRRQIQVRGVLALLSQQQSCQDCVCAWTHHHQWRCRWCVKCHQIRCWLPCRIRLCVLPSSGFSVSSGEDVMRVSERCVVLVNILFVQVRVCVCVCVHVCACPWMRVSLRGCGADA